jgi:hypothetical protein
MSRSVTKSLVQKILENPIGYTWTLQGLGMLRLYLDGERRLHIWDSRYRVKDVSQMHTHPWDFRSLVVAGTVRNQIEIEVPAEEGDTTHYKQTIFCGVGGGLRGEPSRVRLVEDSYHTYSEGESYEERAHQIHVSDPDDGTVTIIKRIVVGDSDHALVFWEDGEWVSAEPREATTREVMDITQRSLERWFS